MKYAKYALLDTDFISKLCVARKDDENCMMDRQSVKNQAVFFLAILPLSAIIKRNTKMIRSDREYDCD